MADVFDRIVRKADDATRAIERVTGAMPSPAFFPVTPGGGGVPASLLRDIAEMKNDLRRLRTQGGRPDAQLEDLVTSG